MVPAEGIDRSGTINKLHLKKELTQIRKAARVLRDPGTSCSSWWSPPPPPLDCGRSSAVKNGRVGGNASEHFLQVGTSSSSDNGNGSSEKGNLKSEEKERRRVYLCNWRSQKSDSVISRQIGDVENGKDEGSTSLETDSLCNSKSDGYFSDRFTAGILKCMDSSNKPSIRLTRKKRLKRSNYSSLSSFHRKEKRRIKMLSRYVVDDPPSVRLGRDDEFLNLIDQSDGNSNSCTYEDLGRASAVSHLLGRIKSKGMSCPPMKMMMSHTKEEHSISSNRYAMTNPHTVESWVATTISLNNGDDEVDEQLDSPAQQGCGIPCYWSRGSTPKSRYGTSCSPSLDTLRRKGSSLFRGSTISQRRHYKRRLNSNAAAQSLVPLLDNSADGIGGLSMRGRDSDDEVSANLSELDLEGLSRLGGRRWFSSCRSQEGLELVPLTREVDKEDSLEYIKSLSHKYRPLCFEELIGQNIVVQSLKSAVSRRRIAPIYLFHGPRGVGKTSMARIFAAALNCLATEESKPCGVCRECADFVYGKSRFLEEVDGSNKKGVDKLRNLVDISEVHPLAQPHYKVIVIDQCQLLPSKTWLAFLQLLDKPLPFIVFVLITADIDHVPLTILTRCQKHVFNKISSGDIVTRLRKISIDENLDVESKALEFIALNADGSLRDAETVLDQLSVFDKRITKSLVNELMGVVVSEHKLLKLLELAMSSNASETVRKSREVMDSGVDPLVLISQLVSLIVDIIAGTYASVDTEHNDSFFAGRCLTGRELNRLKHALTLLSEAEKHLRVSSEQSTWFTATLLRLGSMPSPSRSHSTSSRRQTSKETQEDLATMPREANSDEQFAPEKSDSPTSFMVSNHRNSTTKEKLVRLTPNINRDQYIDGKNLSAPHDDDCISRTTTMTCVDSEMLTNIWLLCIDKCRSKTLRLLLHSCGRLVSISETKGGFIADIAFEDSNTKSRAEGFLSSITNSFEVVLQSNVEVRISLLHDSLDHKLINRTPINLEDESTCSSATGISSDLDLRQDPSKMSRKSSDRSRSHEKKCLESMEDSKSDVPFRASKSIHKQGLGTGRLEALYKGTPVKNGMDHPNEDKLIHGMKTLKMNKATTLPEKDGIVRKMDEPISPSLLHDNMRYESGSGGGSCRRRNVCCCFNFNFVGRKKG